MYKHLITEKQQKQIASGETFGEKIQIQGY